MPWTLFASLYRSVYRITHLEERKESIRLLFLLLPSLRPIHLIVQLEKRKDSIRLLFILHRPMCIYIPLFLESKLMPFCAGIHALISLLFLNN